jgi:hypothetical protein
MFLDPRCARLENQKSRSPAVGIGGLSTRLSDTLRDRSIRVVFEAAVCGVRPMTGIPPRADSFPREPGVKARERNLEFTKRLMTSAGWLSSLSEKGRRS